MQDPAALLAFALAGTTGVGIACAAMLKGWQEWLELRRARIDTDRQTGQSELGALRERVRRLVAIASGAEL
jgi:hypothetical protein